MAQTGTVKRPRGASCIFDIFFDIPHPASSPLNERARLIEPPESTHPEVAAEMHEPKNIAKIARFAFPDHDDQTHAARHSIRDLSSAATLNRYDMYLHSFIPFQHTFGLQLTDGTRIHGHVRRYLPIHPDVKSRADVGRRGARAMVILTRATGGERFYASVLKTIEALMMKAKSVPSYIHLDETPARSFLFALYKEHSRLIVKHSQMGSSKGRNDTFCSLQVSVLEFQNNDDTRKDDMIIKGSKIEFDLPESLQPGYDVVGLYSYIEDMKSPMLPLLRCLCAANLTRLISALLCEKRIILVSKNISVLSMCVRGASAILTQGLLVWRHIMIPVLPPHLRKYLATRAPYMVGVLEQFSSNLEMIPGINDVLCVNLDSDEFRTLNMTDASKSIPDLLKTDKRNKNSAQSFHAPDILAKELSEIKKYDEQLWGRDDAPGKKSQHATNNIVDEGEYRDFDEPQRNIKRSIKSSLAGLFGFKKKSIAQPEPDQAGFFGTILQEAGLPSDLNEEGNKHTNLIEGNMQSVNEPTMEELQEGDPLSVNPLRTCENKKGEELIKKCLVSFFLQVYGDMGMYLSMSDGKFWMDRSKFLLRMKQMGEQESAPIFLVLRQLSRSIMFEQFVRCRIAGIEETPQKRALIMPHHIPLFVHCANYLTRNRLAFTYFNIRRLVDATADATVQHSIINISENARQQALELTSDKPQHGNVGSFLKSLLDDCFQYNVSLSQVIGVIWMRLDETRARLWKQPLLALHLLKNLVLHGPLTALSEAMAGIEKVRALRNYTIKNAEATRSIRLAAKQVYNLMIDRCNLFLRRRKVALTKIVQTEKPMEGLQWSDYLIRRLPVTVDFQHIHVLLRPNEFTPSSINAKRVTNNNNVRIEKMDIGINPSLERNRTKEIEKNDFIHGNSPPDADSKFVSQTHHLAENKYDRDDDDSVQSDVPSIHHNTMYRKDVDSRRNNRINGSTYEYYSEDKERSSGSNGRSVNSQMKEIPAIYDTAPAKRNHSSFKKYYEDDARHNGIHSDIGTHRISKHVEAKGSYDIPPRTTLTEKSSSFRPIDSVPLHMYGEQ